MLVVGLIKFNYHSNLDRGPHALLTHNLSSKDPTGLDKGPRPNPNPNPSPKAYGERVSKIKWCGVNRFIVSQHTYTIQCPVFLSTSTKLKVSHVAWSITTLATWTQGPGVFSQP